MLRKKLPKDCCLSTTEKIPVVSGWVGELVLRILST